MSVSRRDSPFANSGLVVTVDEKDWKEDPGRSNGEHSGDLFEGLEFQKKVERIAFEEGGGTQQAPAQRITDFVEGKFSQTLPQTSYIPGIISSPLHELLPRSITEGLRKGLLLFDMKMRGYLTDESQILAAETRTSSPVRVPRDNETLMHIEINGLFPCGEGAGYAGGIVSAAIDGERAAEAVAKYVSKSES